jgi:hypothetical protein
LPHLEQGGRSFSDSFARSDIVVADTLARQHQYRQQSVGSRPPWHDEMMQTRGRNCFNIRRSLSFCGPSALREIYSQQVSRVSENARLSHCLGSLGAMRHRAGLVEGRQRFGIQIAFGSVVHKPKLSIDARLSVRCSTREPGARYAAVDRSPPDGAPQGGGMCRCRG